MTAGLSPGLEALSDLVCGPRRSYLGPCLPFLRPVFPGLPPPPGPSGHFPHQCPTLTPSGTSCPQHSLDSPPTEEPGPWAACVASWCGWVGALGRELPSLLWRRGTLSIFLPCCLLFIHFPAAFKNEKQKLWTFLSCGSLSSLSETNIDF